MSGYRLFSCLVSSVLVFGLGCGSDSGDGGSATEASSEGTATDGAGTASSGGGGTDATGGSSDSTSSGTAGPGSTGTSTETTGALPDPDDLFVDVTFYPHPEVNTVLVVEWGQNVASDSTRLQFTFENDEWLESPAKPGDTGDHKEVVLGVPESADLSFRLVAEVDGTEIPSEDFNTINGDAPMDLPRAEIQIYEQDLASDNRWMIGAVSERGDGGYGGPNWIYIMDREGRVVWYHRPAGGDNGELTRTFWPRFSRDGTHISIDRQGNDEGDLLFTTLDFEYTHEVRLPGQNECYDVTTDGHILYDTGGGLWEISPSGDRREVWDCPFRNCYSNTVNWDPASDSVLMSLPFRNSVVQIDRVSGDLLRTFGDDGDWVFSPSHLGLDFNHWAHITTEGTFMVSSHIPGTNTHLFMEYTIDDSTQTLTEVWSYGEGVNDWPDERGMAMRLPGGNTLGNYGPTGVIVEVTYGKEVAWRVDFHDKLLSNNILTNDLYALNRGP